MTKKPETKAKKVKAKPVDKKAPEKTIRVKYEIISLVLLMLAVFIYLSVKKFYGLPEDALFIGILGTRISRGLNWLLGGGAIISSFFLFLWSVHIGVNKKMWSGQMWGLVILFLVILVWISIYTIPTGMAELEAGLKGMGGGALGGALAFALMQLLGKVGSLILLVVCVIIAALMVINQPLEKIMSAVSSTARKTGKMFAELLFYAEEDGPIESGEKNIPLIIDHQEKPPPVRSR